MDFHLSPLKIAKNHLELMKYFVAGSTARTAAELAGVHRNTAVRFFHKLRHRIAKKQQERAAQFAGEIELDESYFGGVRKGKRGRGAAGKIPVFGLLKRGGHVHALGHEVQLLGLRRADQVGQEPRPAVVAGQPHSGERRGHDGGVDRDAEVAREGQAEARARRGTADRRDRRVGPEE